jgi:hypothetical protein
LGAADDLNRFEGRPSASRFFSASWRAKSTPPTERLSRLRLALFRQRESAVEDTHGVIGMLDRIREPSNPPGVALPRDASRADAAAGSLGFEDP